LVAAAEVTVASEMSIDVNLSPLNQ